MQHFDCQIHHSDGVSWASCAGDFDCVLPTDVRETLLAAARVNQHRLVLDLTDVSYILSLGLGQLFALAEILRRNGGALILVCPPGNVARLLQVSGIDSSATSLRMYESLQTALSAVSPARGSSSD